MKFVLASGNSHKAEEFSTLFNEDILSVVNADEKLEVVEDGVSFNENALKKAEAYFNKYKTPILSDDSGIVVEAIPEELGIHSARFGGEGLNDKDRALLLLDKLKNQENRNAYFVCVLCFYISPEEVFFFEGRLNGKISDTYLGEHGFGYDPVFIPEGGPGENETVAMHPEWKSLNSHRAVACKFAQNFFQGRS